MIMVAIPISEKKSLLYEHMLDPIILREDNGENDHLFIINPLCCFLLNGMQ